MAKASRKRGQQGLGSPEMPAEKKRSIQSAGGKASHKNDNSRQEDSDT